MGGFCIRTKSIKKVKVTYLTRTDEVVWSGQVSFRLLFGSAIVLQFEMEVFIFSKVTLEENFRNGYAYFPNIFENVGRIEMRFRRKGRKETVVIKQVRMPVLPEDCRND